MSSLVIAGNTSGTITLQAPSIAGTSTVLTLPATSGKVLTDTTPNLAGNGPAFGVYKNSAQTAYSGFAKVKLDFEEFDTDNCFDSTTNYRFQPTVAGYYQISGNATRASANCSMAAAIYKNGSNIKQGPVTYTYSGGAFVTGLLYMNGTTDYVELWAYMDVTQDLVSSQNGTYFCGFLARRA